MPNKIMLFADNGKSQKLLEKLGVDVIQVLFILCIRRNQSKF